MEVKKTSLSPSLCKAMPNETVQMVETFEVILTCLFSATTLSVSGYKEFSFTMLTNHHKLWMS